MRKRDLAHILRASAVILDERDFVVVGSQSIWGTSDRAPPSCLSSMEAGLYPLRNPADSNVLSSTIGELSPFHDSFGYYADGASPSLSVLPDGWRKRLRRLDVDGTVAWCLSIPDLAIAKYAAGREKDLLFNKELIELGLVQEAELLGLVKKTKFRHDGDAKRVTAKIRADFAAYGQGHETPVRGR